MNFINDLTEENSRVYISNRQLLEIIFSSFGIDEKISDVDREIPYISSDDNCDMLNRILSLLTCLKSENEQIDDLIDDFNILKSEMCPRIVIPQCLQTDNIKLQSMFTRYNPLRDYSFLERQFHYIFNTITSHLKTTSVHPINLGIFLITIGENITFVKASWDDCRDRDSYKTFVDMELYEILMRNPKFNEFMKLYMIKIVQDKFVMGNCSGTFPVLLDLFLDRGIDVKDYFHQDQAEQMEVEYFTLTYIIPKERVILGASLLGLIPRSAVSVPVTNMTTLGVSNELYHSTPSCCTSRQYSWTNPKTKTRRTFSNARRTAKIERVLRDDSRQPTVQQGTVELFPSELTLDSSSRGLMNQMLIDTENTRRTFIRTLYIITNILYQPPDSVSYTEIIYISPAELMEETMNIERKTISKILDYVVGGKKPQKKVSESVKMISDPKRNVIFYFEKKTRK